MLQVAIIVNCYGQTEGITKMFHKSEWDKIQEQGYYMAQRKIDLIIDLIVKGA